MITNEKTPFRNHDWQSGFTLVEILVTMLILTLISAAVFSTFLFFNRSGINIGQYTDMDRQARKALERFAVDIRMAEKIIAFNSTHLRVQVPIGDLPIDPLKYGDSPGAYYEVDYALSGTSLVRQVTHTDNSAIMPATTETLLTGLQGDSSGAALEFTRYGIGSPLDPDIPEANSASETTQINIRLRAVRSWAKIRESTNIILSGRYVLRNKLN